MQISKCYNIYSELWFKQWPLGHFLEVLLVAFAEYIMFCWVQVGEQVSYYTHTLYSMNYGLGKEKSIC